MINLLPPEHKNDIRYGRTNLLLIRWLALGLLAVGIMVIMMGAGWFYINQQSKNLNKDIANTNLQLQAQNLPQVKKAGSVLNALSLSKTSGAIDLTISSVDPNSAAQAAANLSDPKNNLFTKADVINVVCQNTSTYACTATIKALFSANVQKEFLSVPGANK
jgi:hypothetical protein